MDFIPKEDKSEFEIQVKASAGISLEQMTRECQAIQNEVKKDKNVESWLAIHKEWEKYRQKHHLKNLTVNE